MNPTPFAADSPTQFHTMLPLATQRARDSLFGQILLSFNLVTPEQLERALNVQSRSTPPQPLGQVLLEQGILDEKTISSILRVQSRKVGKQPVVTPVESSNLEKLFEDAAPDRYLRAARSIGASDLHLSSGLEPTARLYGALVRFPRQPLTLADVEKILYSFLDDDARRRLQSQKSVDVGISHPEHGRFRLNVFHHSQGLAGTLRVIPDEIWSFERLGLPVAVQELTGFKNGLVLVTGATGSGKSTTLSCLLDLINSNQRKHIVTLEEPIEVVHENKLSVVSQREIPLHAHTFSSALRSALREDPDVIVLGEMRDPDTVATALTAAETGHLVMGTLHTRNAPSSVLRLLDLFPSGSRAHVRTLLANVLRGVISQQLVPTVAEDGLCLAHEIMFVNPAIANLIREDRIWQIRTTMQLARSEGMVLMDDSLLALLEARRISLEEALSRASEREKFLDPRKDQHGGNR